MKFYYNVIQQTDEWFEIKKGKLSASHATAIGNQGKGLETLCRNIVKDMIVPKKQSYVSDDMKRGNDLEPIARTIYEFETGLTVQEVGFIDFNDYAGVSPDGLAGIDGLIEIKSRNDEKHFGLLLGDSVDSSTIWQMNMQMLVADRKWCDFCSYNPNYKQSLFIKRFYPEEKKIKDLLTGIEKGEQMIRELIKKENVIIEFGNKIK